MKMRVLTIAVVLAVMIASFRTGFVGNEPEGCVHAQDKKPPPTTSKEREDKSSVWMAMKLKSTEQILGGLAHGDFKAIRESASAMALTGYLEKWFRAEDPVYKRQVMLFEAANAELIRQAAAQNLEGATLAYNQLTVSCVQCHKIVRDAKK